MFTKILIIIGIVIALRFFLRSFFVKEPKQQTQKNKNDGVVELEKGKDGKYRPKK